MMKIIGILLVIPVVIFAGCAKYKLPDPPHKVVIPAVDADQNGVVDERDVEVLEARANDRFDKHVLPFFQKAGIELAKQEDVFTEENTEILKKKLTVAEWEKLEDGMKQWNKARIQLESTKMSLEASPPIVDFGVVRGDSAHPKRMICLLEDGRRVYLIGISIPDHTTRYRKMSDEMFYKLALRKLVKMERDVEEKARDFLYAYVYVGDICVNAEMVAKGYAKATPTPPNHKYDSLFMKLEKEAREKKKGIWAFADDF